MPAQSNTSSGAAYTPPTDYALCKPWGGWYKFMLSYNLKPHDDDDVQEGKRILEGFREMDRQEWEAQRS